MKKYNVIWVFVDSVRRYYSDDDRSRLEYMDEFAKESVEFKNVVTSAPSTYMSVSAMMTGCHSYFISRNFSDFSFDDKQINSLPHRLLSHGYENFSFWMHPVSRTYMRQILPGVERAFWPRGFKNHLWWNNRMIVDLVKSTLQKMTPSDSPKFFFVDFNCREDPTTNECVKDVFEQFKAHGYDDSNSIMVLCSDHGYPDPGKDEGHPAYYRKMNVSHDLLLTDDNIMIPMSIRYPGCPKGKKVETTIGTIDMMPTVMDILGLDRSSYCDAHGTSLLPLINGHPEVSSDMAGRFQRSDSRFSMQTGKGTAIRNGEFKYIYYHDDIRGKGNEEFFDVINDPEERVNLISSDDLTIQQGVSLFRRMYNKSEEEAFEFQLKYLLSRFEPEYEDLVMNSDSVLVLDSCNPIFADLIVSICRKIKPNIECVLLLVEHEEVEFFKFDNVISSEGSSWAEVAKADIPLDLINRLFDLVMVPYNTSEGRDNASLKSFLRKLSPKKAVWLDYNMEVPSGFSQKYNKNYIVARWAGIRSDPLKAISSVKRKLIRILASVFRSNVKDN